MTVSEVKTELQQ